jgi:hypothetical protein
MHVRALRCQSINVGDLDVGLTSLKLFIYQNCDNSSVVLVRPFSVLLDMGCAGDLKVIALYNNFFFNFYIEIFKLLLHVHFRQLY